MVLWVHLQVYIKLLCFPIINKICSYVLDPPVPQRGSESLLAFLPLSLLCAVFDCTGVADFPGPSRYWLSFRGGIRSLIRSRPRASSKLRILCWSENPLMATEKQERKDLSWTAKWQAPSFLAHSSLLGKSTEGWLRSTRVVRAIGNIWFELALSWSY